MGFLAVGINHRTAPVEVRERVSFLPGQLTPALQHLCQQPGIRQAAILSTCNRTELYVHGPAHADSLTEWLATFHRAVPEQLTCHIYSHRNARAVSHMMRVASGLDSMILGEPQIFGQMKAAYAAAQQAGTVRGPLDLLFQSVFATVKNVRSQTAIGENPVSVAFAAVCLARQIFSDLSRNTALLIGAGETIELVARHMKEQGVGRIVIANRTLSSALTLAEKLGGEAISLGDIPATLARADMVISSTASPLPLLGKGAVESALKERRHVPMFMVDLAVPKDIEPEVGQLADVYLYTVDELHNVIEDGRRNRQQAAHDAEKIIAEGTTAFFSRLHSTDAADSIRRYRQQATRIQTRELQKALRQLDSGHNPHVVVEQLARGLTNKLIHAPCVQLRHAGSRGEQEKILWAQEFLALECDTESQPRIPLPGKDPEICEEPNK